MGNKDLETHVELTTQRSREGTSPLPTHGEPHGVREPDAQTTPQWCKRCKADVIPRGKGLCPRCGIFLRQNFVARRHPVNVLRREALLADLLKDFPPTNSRERKTLEQLADIYEQLETTRAGTPESQRLTQMRQTLESSLDEVKREPDANPYENFTEDQLIERLEALLKYAHETRDLTQHLERTAAAERAQPAPVLGTPVLPTPTPDLASFVAPAEPVTPTPCHYCNRSPCLGVEHPAFYALHPEAAQARDDARVNQEFRLAFGLDKWPR